MLILARFVKFITKEDRRKAEALDFSKDQETKIMKFGTIGAGTVALAFARESLAKVTKWS